MRHTNAILLILVFNFPEHIIFGVVIPVEGAAVGFRLLTDIADRDSLVAFFRTQVDQDLFQPVLSVSHLCQPLYLLHQTFESIRKILILEALH